MSVRMRNPELTLYVTSDPQGVAMHQSICRSNFPINFVDDVGTDEVERPPNEDDNMDIIEETDILGDISNKANDLYIGMVFKDRMAFKQHMALHAINNKFRFRTSKSAPGGMVLNCISTACRWRVYAVRLKNSDLFEIRTVELMHTCSVDDRSGYQRQATHAVIGEMMRTRYAGPGGGPRPNEIIQVMRGDHDVHISYWKAWRAREVALDYSKGAGASYNLLPEYLNKLVSANPGTIAEIHTDHHENLGNQFKYMFLAMGASIKGYQYMRKVVVIDGTHLRGKYAGSLLTASAQDGNFRVFPLAIGIVDGETDKAWEWFFEKLKAIVPDNEEIVFVSDRHASIYYGLAKVFPNARHCACILHLKRNIRTNFKDKHLGYLVGKAARAFKVSEFYSVFNEIKRINASCAEYLIGIGFEHWTRSHFPGNRYNIMTSNVAETLNSVLREAREYPILKLVEYIRAKLMSWFATRRAEGTSGRESLTPRVLEILSVNFESSGSFVVNLINASEYDVRDKSGGSYHVDLARKICSCFIFQMLKIPCSHAVAAAVRSNVRVDSLVAVEYSVASMLAAYENSIAPVTVGEYISQHVADMSSMNMVPPSSRRPPGRPRKNRYFSRGEIRMNTPRKRTMCSRCKGCGHNRATCKMAI